MLSFVSRKFIFKVSSVKHWALTSNVEVSQTRLTKAENQKPLTPEVKQSQVRHIVPTRIRRQYFRGRMDSTKEEAGVQNSGANGANNTENRPQDSYPPEHNSEGTGARSKGGSYQRNSDNFRRGDRNRGNFSHMQNDQRGWNNYRGRGGQYYERGGPAPGGYYNQQGRGRNQNMQDGSYQDQQYSSGNANQYRGRGRRDDNDEVFISKTLSYILRHGAEKQGLKLMKGGFLYVDDILRRTEKLQGVMVDQIEKIVKTNDKQRFALEEDENGRLMIRANQGHTMEVDDLKLEEITSADQVSDVIHGTYNSSWEIIKKSGLSRMSRNHVHFAPGEPGESGVISGMRSTCDVLIYIDIKKALKDGLKFYRSANNVILCPGDETGVIYPCYFSGAVMRRPRQRLEFDNTIDKNTVKHEPVAKAGKYSDKNDRQRNIPVGLAVESKKEKKKKRKNKDKEADEEQTETREEKVKDNLKPAAKKQATEEGIENSSAKKTGEVEGEQVESMQGDNDKISEKENNQSDTSSAKAVACDELDSCDKQIKDCHIDHTDESQLPDEAMQDPAPSSNAKSTSADSSAVTTGANNNEITVISDIEVSIPAMDSLMQKKPDTLAVCCYGYKLGTEESKIHLISLVTADCAYVYDNRGGDDLFKEGHVKELFEDTDINKVFNNIEPQSLSLLQDCDILLDGTPVWDLTLVYDNCRGTLTSDAKKTIENEKLNPADWDDLTAVINDKGLDKDIQHKLLQRGRDMLKLFSYFHKDQIKDVKKKVYEAVKPPDGSDLMDKFKRLKDERKKEKERKKKEEKQKEQEEQAKQQKKSGQAHGQKKSQKKKK